MNRTQRFDTFIMTIKNYDILSNKNDLTQYHTRNIGWDNIINRKNNEQTKAKYIKPYEKNNIF